MNDYTIVANGMEYRCETLKEAVELAGMLKEIDTNMEIQTYW